MKHLVSAAALLIMILAIALPSALTQYNEFVYLRNEGKEGVATVTAKDCGNHGRLHWDLHLQDSVVRGISNNCAIQTRCEDIEIGYQLKVRYIEPTPRINDCESVAQKADEMLLMIGILVFVCLGICIYSVYKYKKENH